MGTWGGQLVGGVEITGARIIIGAAAVKIDRVRKRRIIIFMDCGSINQTRLD